MTRDKHTVKFTKPIYSNKDGLQLATPEIAAKYIAKRLKTKTIADLGCGIGGQVIFFAQECDKVYAVERNPEKIEYAKKNCELYGVDNVEFILGDALSPETRDKISDSDIIFSDPARPLAEKKRTLDNLQPPISELIKLYSNVTTKLAFHAPPQMPPERIGLDCEYEYMSISGQLNRLTLYFGDLKQCERSAFVLPANVYLASSDAPDIETRNIEEYVYEPEPAVLKAGLLGELAGAISDGGESVYFYNGNNKRTLLTSKNLIDSPFFKDRYRILGKTEQDIPQIKAMLTSVNAGKVVLRFEVPPDEYWNTRNELENELEGSKNVHLFGFGDEVLVCEKIKR